MNEKEIREGSFENPSVNYPPNPQASQSPIMSTKVPNKVPTPKEPLHDDFSPKNLKEVNQSRNEQKQGNADTFMTHNQNLEANRAKRQNNQIHYSFGEAPFGELHGQQFPSRSPAAHFESENQYQSQQIAESSTSGNRPTVVGQDQAPRNISHESMHHDRQSITNSNSTILVRPGEKAQQNNEQAQTNRQQNDEAKLTTRERKSEISIHSIQNSFQMPVTPGGGHANVFQNAVQNHRQGTDAVTPHLPSSRKPFENGPDISNQSRELETANLGGNIGGSGGGKTPPLTGNQPQNNEEHRYLNQVTSSEHLAPGQVSSQNLQNTQMMVHKTEQLVQNGRLRQSQEYLSTGYAQQDEKLVLSYNTSGANTIQTRQVSHVPETIRQEMVKKGFRPSSQQEDQFEYESDTVERYEMISNEFNYEEVRTGERFGIKQYRDCIYRGQLANNKKFREGLGVLVYESGRIYEGEWEANKRHGRGYEMFANGNMYHGSYKEGKAHGKGVYQWQNGEVYDGEWIMGVKHGYGVWRGINGESYIGQWHEGKAQGYGVHVWGNGDKYEGEWLACLRHGNGSDFFANGDCYVGQYAHGKPEGFGQYKWINGSSYTGQFEGGLKHGHGKWKKKQADDKGQVRCNSYEGMYKNDKKHGKGVFEWESGNRYIGSYLNDERHGYGVMEWTDGSKYMGTWVDGIQHGIGVMIFPDGARRAGIFEDNIFKESVKKKEQIDKHRDVLSEECIEILEELMTQKVQSKVNLLAPSKKSLKNLKKKQQSMTGLQVEEVRSSVKRSTPGATETQEDFQKPPSSQLMSSQVFSSGMLSKTALVRSSSKLRDKKGSVESGVSDQRSLVNKKLQTAELEDKNMTMQKGKFMNNPKAIQSEAKPKPKSRPQEQKPSRKPSISSLPPTAPQQVKPSHPQQVSTKKPRPAPVQTKKSSPFYEKQNTVPAIPEHNKQPSPIIPGKTIEVQTDLSMLTMRQYEHSEHGRTITDQQRKWIKTAVQEQPEGATNQHPDRQKLNLNSYDQASNQQTNTQHGSPSLYRTTPFEEVLSKPQFENTRHQQEILGSENPNEDTESEWNRNSSIMGHPPTQGQKKRTNQFRGDLKNVKKDQNQSFAGDTIQNSHEVRVSAGHPSQNTIQDESINSQNLREENVLKGPDYFKNVAPQNFSRQDQHPYSRQGHHSGLGNSKQPVRNAQERAEVKQLMSLPHHVTKFGGSPEAQNDRKRPPRGNQATRRPNAREQGIIQSRQVGPKQMSVPSRGPNYQQRASRQRLAPISPKNVPGLKGKNRSRQNFFSQISTQIAERGNPLQRVQLQQSIYQEKKKQGTNTMNRDYYLNQESGALDKSTFDAQEVPYEMDRADLQQEMGGYEIRDQGPHYGVEKQMPPPFYAQNQYQNYEQQNPQVYDNRELSQEIRRRERRENDGSLETQKKMNLYGVENTPTVHPNMRSYTQTNNNNPQIAQNRSDRPEENLSHFENQDARRDQVKKEYALEQIGARTNYFRPPINNHRGVYLPRMASAERPPMPRTEDMLSMSPQEKDSSHMSALGTGGPPIPSGHLSNAFGFDRSFQKQYVQNDLSEERQIESQMRAAEKQQQKEPILQQETELEELEDQQNQQKSLVFANSQTSSSKTLRYNDFELINKGISASEMGNYQIQLDDQEQQTRSVSRQDLKLSQTSSIDYEIQEQLSYPEIHLSKANKDLDPDVRYSQKKKAQQKRQSVPRNEKREVMPQSYPTKSAKETRPNRTHSLQPPIPTNQKPFDANQAQVASVEAQQRQRQADRNLMNSNDTQLADHTIGMQQAGIDVSGATSRHANDGYNSSGNMHQSMRRVQRSVPMHFDRPQKSKISVNQNRLFYPEENRNLSNSIVESRVRKLSPDQQFYAHQANLMRVSPQRSHNSIMPKKKRLRNVNVPNAGGGSSYQSIHASARRDLTGPYAQNLRRPKLYEARGGQKIAIKNQISAMQKQSIEAQIHSNPTQLSTRDQQLNLGFQSDTSQRLKNNNTIAARLRNSSSRQRNSQFLGFDARGDKFSNRTGAQTQIEQPISSNFVVPIPGVKNSFQHYENMLPGQQSNVQKTLVSSMNHPPKRVWVPYNKKMKLKGFQQNMLVGSGQRGSINKLTSSQEEFPIHQGLYVHST